VSPRYRRLLEPLAPTGAISQRPALSSPTRAAKHDAESKRGKHSQSIDPSVETRAAV
jgi:hypothetical protein